jgi:hypothetical protein
MKLTNGRLTTALLELTDELGAWPEAVLIVGRKLTALLNNDTEYERVKKQAKRALDSVQGNPPDAMSSSMTATGSAPQEGALPVAAVAEPTAPPRTYVTADWWPHDELKEKVLGGDLPLPEANLKDAVLDFILRYEEEKPKRSWDATFIRFCRWRVHEEWFKPRKFEPFFPPQRRRKRKEGATGLAGGDSRTKVTKGSSTALVPASGAPVDEFRVYEGSPEAEAWAAYKGGKLSFPKSDLDLGKNYRIERTQWPLNHLDLEKRNGSWG